MKTNLIHSANIGLIAMIIVALIAVVLGALISLSNPGQESLSNLIYFTWFPLAMTAPISLPALMAIVAWITWRQTRDLLTNLDSREAKKQVMISAWLSTGIATLPFLLLTLLLYYFSVTTPGGGAGAGMGEFFSMLCLLWNLFLIVVVGFFARLFVPKVKVNDP